MWLGPVYGSEEIAKQMPRERKEFAAADAKWRTIMQGVQRQPEILRVGGYMVGAHPCVAVFCPAAGA
jgi:hypothetical protein